MQKNYVVEETLTGINIYFETEGVRTTFLPNEDNPNYQEYLAFTAWVEAGNDPDEFWTQAEAI